MSISENIQKMKSEIPEGVTLVAVSKTKPISDIEKAYNSGQLIFGENKVQELVEKHNKLPKNIQWHMIGHLQTNKVKFIAPFVSLIHGVDSEKLLIEIDKRGKQNNRIIDCLLQVHITRESAKFGFSSEEIKDI
ncbi:MAG: YggS family pyridoxal phosphate-dependent enzyme, partial [Flavobacteriales bacterium]|nr:YggS family pyridoxal phosphate-dependent enzyme [Flavobacteriales bacterium]